MSARNPLENGKARLVVAVRILVSWKTWINFKSRKHYFNFLIWSLGWLFCSIHVVIIKTLLSQVFSPWEHISTKKKEVWTLVWKSRKNIAARVKEAARARSAEGIPGGLQAAAKFQLQLSELKKTLETMSHRGVPGLFCSGKARWGMDLRQLAKAQTPRYHAPATELICSI